MARPGAISGKLREVLGVDEVEVGVEAEIGRGGFIVDIEFGQVRRFLLTRRGGFFRFVTQALVDLQAIEQQIAAFAGFFVP